MIAFDIAVTGLALNGLAWPALIAAGKLHAGHCPAPAVPAAATPPLDRPAQPVTASSNGAARRVREPGTGYTVSKKRLAELAAASSGSEAT